jgi:hypothetical protein
MIGTVKAGLMRTPAGGECSFFYQDYFRGKSLQECRLPSIGAAWRPALCSTCPVPGIQMANGCPDMSLRGIVRVRWLGLQRRVHVFAYCRRANCSVENPYIGCGICHGHVLDSFVLPPDVPA